MSLIIFDFDGTLVDSYQLTLDGVNTFFAQHGLPPIEQLQQLQKAIWTSLWRYHIRLFGIKRFVLDYLAKHIVTCTMQDEMITTLKELHASGHTLGIISSNRTKTVDLFLEHHHLQDLFSFVLHAGWSKTKSLLLKQIKMNGQLHEKQIFYVCDSVDDIQQATPSITAVAVSWGYETIAHLQAAKPYALIQEPRELLGVCEIGSG